MRILFILMFLSLSSHATDLGQIYEVIKYVETNNEDSAIGDNGKAFGVVQIHKICVDDVNRIYGTNYNHKDMFYGDCSREVFMLYMNAGIKRFKRVHKKEPTEKDIVRFWNGGFYRGYKIKATIKYWLRYLKFKKLLKL